MEKINYLMHVDSTININIMPFSQFKLFLCTDECSCCPQLRARTGWISKLKFILSQWCLLVVTCPGTPTGTSTSHSSGAVTLHRSSAISLSSVAVATISFSSQWATTHTMSHSSDAVTLPTSSAIDLSSVTAATISISSRGNTIHSLSSGFGSHCIL